MILGVGRPKIPLEERFETYKRILPSGCWEWTGALTKDGYGIIRVDGKNKRVHRVSYEFYVAPIPKGLTIDHVKDRGCITRACFWPEHLEPVTLKVNIGRGETGQHTNSKKEQCRHGHDFAEFGRAQYHKDGSFKQRVCMECQRLASAEWEARRPKRTRPKRS